jgi:hypothetical protein
LSEERERKERKERRHPHFSNRQSDLSFLVGPFLAREGHLQWHLDELGMYTLQIDYLNDRKPPAFEDVDKFSVGFGEQF